MMRRWAVAGLTVAVALPLLALQDRPKESRTAYIRRMYSTNRCTFGDAARAVAALVAGAPVDDPFPALRKRLVDGGVMPDAWDDLEETELTRGKLSYLLCGALQIKGGVTMSLFGRSQRYALRELLFIGIIESGSTEQFVSGRELIDIVRRSEVYKKEGSLDSIRK